MELLQRVMTTLKRREEKLIKQQQSNERLNSLSRTLLDSLSNMLRDAEQPMTYDQRKALKNETIDMTAEIKSFMDSKEEFISSREEES